MFDAEGEKNQETLRREADVYLARAEFADFAERFEIGTWPWFAGGDAPGNGGNPSGNSERMP